jgi:NAD-dependent dihydropyrimidine dehydrogenase PreA subunit/bacterioferritin-associated ferredoxin
VKRITYEIEIVDENCTGCYRCERACPTSAITMVGPKTEALAVVNNDACIACFRCIDSCDDDAMFPREREEPIEVGFPLDGADLEAVGKLCATAGVDPETTICLCSGSMGKEVAAAILAGHTTFDAVARVTGVQSGCLIYCSAPIQSLLTAQTGEMKDDSKVRRYETRQTVYDLPETITDPDLEKFGIAVERRLFTEQMANVEVEI